MTARTAPIIFLLTTIAMIAFAANSVLGRMALTEGEIGAGSFALIRLVSGAVMLVALVTVKRKALGGDWRSAVALLVYAGFFSYAYITLPAGTGALILFAVVQMTMLGAGLFAGERMSSVQTLGLVAALSALIWLLSPGLDAPSPLGATAMALAGAGWGVYSLTGRSSADPIAATAGNFLRAALLAALLAVPILVFAPEVRPQPRGIGLAILSGAAASGLGYSVWYAALSGLTRVRAGIAQLTVPALAAAGGVLFLNEPLTLRFLLASLIILGGVALATLIPAKTPPH